MIDPTERKEMMSARFRQIYGREPQVWCRAPGRVDLMGSHTDYNQGFVMTMTIDRDTWIAAAPRPDRRVAVCSLDLAGRGEFSLDDLAQPAPLPLSSPDWTAYVAGVAWALGANGWPLTGFDGLVGSIVPIGSGLSSSAALEMAVASLFETLGGYSIDRLRLARLGQQAENQYVGMSCGILDQFSSVMGKAGGAILLDCRSLDGRTIPMAPGLAVAICDTRAERRLVGTEYSQRRAQCEEGARILGVLYPGVTALRDVSADMLTRHRSDLSELVYKRCQFIVEENARVLDLAACLPRGDRARLGALFAASFAGAHLLYEITVPAMEAMHLAMLAAPGVIAARQAGAGFGGCLVALVEKAKAEAFAEYVSQAYASATGIEPNVYTVQASEGAGIF
jgi:galactokinase